MSMEVSMEVSKTDLQHEVDRNYEAFKALGADFRHENFGKFALMKNEKIVKLYSSREDAVEAGHFLFKDGLFSVQMVGRPAAMLGFQTYAVL
ncbi:MAG: hypothetical protein OXU78_01880 [Deltaproteobacteria bacterium]|nr:hypothetical protein [Deltaproteobacteria bacterium]